MMRRIQCPYCGRDSSLQTHPSGSRFGKIWKCDPCQAWTGVHKGSRDFAPLGRLANAELRKLKMATHAAFDPIWRDGHMSRSAAYKLLCRRMGQPKTRSFHIGFLDADQCRKVIEIASDLHANLRAEIGL